MHEMKRKLIALSFVLGMLWFSPTTHARLMRLWSYQELHARADLVVIARPRAVRHLQEQSALPNIQRLLPGGTRAPVIGRAVETDFEVVVLLKGAETALTGGKLTLYHFQLPPAPMLNGPGLVAFEPTAQTQYLLFLVRRMDGRYETVSGQTDPDQAIEPLRMPGP